MAVPMSVVRNLAAKGRMTMVIDGVAWDLTDFADDHPGGSGYITRNVGKDATEEFVASHPVDIIERTLTREQFEVGKGSMCLGEVDPTTITQADIASFDTQAQQGGEQEQKGPGGEKPTLESCINLYDFEAIARETIAEQGWVYYSSGADDEITLRENHSAFQRLWLRPRVLVNVKHVDTATHVLGAPSSLPLMLCAVAMCKMGHPDGEVAWNQAAGNAGIPYMIPTLSGCSFKVIIRWRKRCKGSRVSC